MLLNLSHHCSVAMNILFVTISQTENDSDQIFHLPSVLLHVDSLDSVDITLVAVSVRKIDENLSFAFVLNTGNPYSMCV